jgi:predicted secreted protein
VWRDFAARIKRSVTPQFKDANHRPVVKVEGPLDRTVRPGATVQLAAATSDPDGNAVSVKWRQYKSLGTYPGEITIGDPTALKTSFVVPEDAQPGATIHVVVEATDDGTPPLTYYQHLILTVEGGGGDRAAAARPMRGR